MLNPMDLSGKHILVTGASRGLGRQSCITLSRLGARISLIARNSEGMQKTLTEMEGNSHSYFPFDLNDVENIEDLVTRIVDKQGKFDGFVHCAGIGPLIPLAMTKVNKMKEVMNVNLFAFVEMARNIAKKKNCNIGASIIGVSSAVSRHADKGQTAYAASKGAMDSAILPMAIELGEKMKIRVNTINPGWVKTDMYNDYVNTFGIEKMIEMDKKHILGIAEPCDIANVIAFLLSPAASQITGQSIVVDGGWSIR